MVVIAAGLHNGVADCFAAHLLSVPAWHSFGSKY